MVGPDERGVMFIHCLTAELYTHRGADSQGQSEGHDDEWQLQLVPAVYTPKLF